MVTINGQNYPPGTQVTTTQNCTQCQYTPPVYTPPVYTPPVYSPPVYSPPVYSPPVYEPPIYYEPPRYNPPPQKPPVYHQPPPVYEQPQYNFDFNQENKYKTYNFNQYNKYFQKNVYPINVHVNVQQPTYYMPRPCPPPPCKNNNDSFDLEAFLPILLALLSDDGGSSCYAPSPCDSGCDPGYEDYVDPADPTEQPQSNSSGDPYIHLKGDVDIDRDGDLDKGVKYNTPAGNEKWDILWTPMTEDGKLDTENYYRALTAGKDVINARLAHFSLGHGDPDRNGTDEPIPNGSIISDLQGISGGVEYSVESPRNENGQLRKNGVPVVKYTDPETGEEKVLKVGETVETRNGTLSLSGPEGQYSNGVLTITNDELETKVSFINSEGWPHGYLNTEVIPRKDGKGTDAIYAGRDSRGRRMAYNITGALAFLLGKHDSADDLRTLLSNATTGSQAISNAFRVDNPFDFSDNYLLDGQDKFIPYIEGVNLAADTAAA